jgi:oligosaccharide repeat unit polymerase
MWAGIFLVIGIIRTVGNVQGQRLLSTEYVGIGNAMLAMIYVYLGTAYTNLQYVLANVHELMYGTLLLRVPLSIMQMGHLSEPPYINWDAWNTITALGHYYFDFGWVGVFGIPLVLGAVSSAVYVKARASADPSYTIFFGITANAILASITTDRFFEGSTLWYIAVTMVVARFCRRASPVSNVAASGALARRPLPTSAAFDRS